MKKANFLEIEELMKLNESSGVTTLIKGVRLIQKDEYCIYRISARVLCLFLSILWFGLAYDIHNSDEVFSIHVLFAVLLLAVTVMIVWVCGKFLSFIDVEYTVYIDKECNILELLSKYIVIATNGNFAILKDRRL